MKDYGDKETSLATQPAQQEPVSLPCCGYTDASAVKWNPYNQVLQCHNCGQVYTSPPASKPLTDEQKRELIEKSALWDMHIHIGWYSAPAKSFVEKATQLIADIEAAHGITKGST